MTANEIETEVESAAVRQARVLVLAPWGRNAEVLGHVLDEAGLPCQLCPSAEALVAEAANGVGALLLAAPVLSPADSAILGEMLEQQPPWSQPPLVLLVDEETAAEGVPAWVRHLNGRASVTLLSQPVRAFTLVSTLQAALAARRQQYEMRDLHAHLEARVEARTEQVRRLATQLARTEGQERKRIAGILHDHLQQVLYGLQFMTARLQTQVEPPHLSLVEQFDELLTEAVRTTRTLSVDLSPPVLETGGLAEALTWLAEQMGERHGLDVTVDVEEASLEVSQELRTLIFENVRELLFNVVKHAGVDQAWVHVHYDEGQVTVNVEDRGQGMDVDALSAPTESQLSLGLPSVRNRTILYGGEVDIHTTPGAGTCITLLLPL